MSILKMMKRAAEAPPAAPPATASVLQQLQAPSSSPPPAAPDAAAPTPPVAPAPPAAEVTYRDFGDTDAVRRAIYARTLAAARALKPVSNSRYQMSVEDVDYEDPEEHPVRRQKEAILKGETLARRLRGTWVLRDLEGQELSRKRSTLAQVPYMTQRGTFILNGTEQALKHQMRLRAGMFARAKENGELEAHANFLPGKGLSHRYMLEPDTGTFKMQVSQASMPLYSVLRHVYGLPDGKLREAWGNELWEANAGRDDPRVVDKLFQRLVRKGDPGATPEAKARSVRETLEKMEFDPEVNKRTLGHEHRNLDADAVLAATRKLLMINRGEAEADDRDHLAYQQFLGPEDLIAERLERPGTVMHQLLWKASTKGSLDSVPVNAFNRHLNAAITESGLGHCIEEINPAEIFDLQTAASRMGVGGIPSADSIPDSARDVHPSQTGYVDLLRTPESLSAGVDVRMAFAARKGSDGRVYTPYTDVKTNQKVYRSPQDVADQTLAFPGELESGEPFVRALARGKPTYVPRDEVDLVLPHPSQWFNPITNMVPLPSTIKAQRVSMGSRFTTQALPLLEPEAPLVRGQLPGLAGRSFEEHYGKQMGAVHAKDLPGRVEDVGEDAVRVRYQDGSVQEHPLYSNFIYNRKSVSGDTQIFILRDRVVLSLLIKDYEWREGDCTLTADPRSKQPAWLPVTGYLEHRNDKKLYRVTTASGRSVVVTEDHSLVTMGPSGDLVPVYPLDCVVNKTRLPVALLPEFDDDAGRHAATGELGELAGLYLSEGHCPPGQPGLVTIAVKDDARAAEVMSLCERLGHRPYRCTGASVNFTDERRCRYLVETFGHLSHNKHVPGWVLRAAASFRRGLISGYMGGDSCLWADREGAIQVVGVSVSRALRDGLVAVLASLRVFSTLFDAPRNHLDANWRDGYGFRVISRHLSRLPRWFFYSERERKFRELLASEYRASKFELVPVPGKAARRLLYQDFDEVPRRVYQAAHHGAVAKKDLRFLPGIFGKWGRSDVMWDKIVEISAVPDEEWVYDLSVAEAESFAVCLGLIVHNTRLHNSPVVAAGDPVRPGQLLARSNFTDEKGHVALGKNLRVAYVPFQGSNYEDAWVISESAAKKLTSEHMYQHGFDADENARTGKKHFVSMFAAKFDRKTLDTMDEHGVVKPGTRVKSGDPLILAAVERPATHKSVHAGHKGSFADRSVLWEHHTEGVVTDVARTPKGVVVAVKSESPTQVGDKLSNRMGGKGVIARIVPDDKMPRDAASGQPYELLANPLGIISRGNPGSKLELWLGKIAAKTGKPVVVEDFSGREDATAWVEDQLKQHGLEGMDDVEDPDTGRRVPVATGVQYMMKLHHSSECFDDRTEALTERGWVPWPEVRDDDELATVRDGCLVFEKPLKVFRSPFEGDLYCYKGRFLDYAVTGNHRLYLSYYYRKDRRYGFETAARAHGRRFRVPQFGFPQEGPGCHVGEDTLLDVAGARIAAGDYAELVGWWASEGYAQVTPRRAVVALYQSKAANPEKFAQIERLASRLPWPWHRFTGNNGVVISSRALATYLRQYGTHSYNKRLPRDLFGYSPRVLLRAYDALLAGDGHVSHDGLSPTARYVTVSEGLADDFQELCVRAGLGAVVHRVKHRPEMKFKLPDGRHYVSRCRPALECGVALARTAAMADGDRNAAGFSVRPYAGMVYCAEMSTGLLYVRRNGKPMLSGNSKHQGRGLGAYTADDTPARGGAEGCFAPRQVILTSEGPTHISRLCEKRLGVQVKTYSSELNEWVYRPVIDWFVRRAKAADLLTVKTTDGRALFVTPDHVVYRPDGSKVPIGQLTVGDHLATWGPIPTDHQWSLLRGSLLGDASVSEAAFTCEHSVKQIEYVNWKQSMLAGLEAITYDRKGRKTLSRIHGKEVRSDRSRVVSVSYRHVFEPLRSLCCSGPGGAKRVTPEWLAKVDGLGVSVWVLDDGSITNRAKKAGRVNFSGRIATMGFTESECSLLAAWLKDRYGNGCSVDAAGALCLSADLCRSLIAEIARWIPWEVIPGSKKFLRGQVRQLQEVSPPAVPATSCRLGLVPLRIKEVAPYRHDKPGVEEINVYDFSVEDTHCYCASHALVSNSKRLALMDVGALISHGSYDVLRDAKLVRGQKNQEYWSTYMAGFKPATPPVPMVYRKFIDQLRAAGVNVQRRGSQLHLMALTDKDVDHLAENREVTSAETVDWKNGLEPVKGGLFDVTSTGGHGGNKWSFIRLHEPLPNPVMEEPIRKLLRLTGKQFEDVVAGRTRLEGKTGTAAVQSALAKINVPDAIRQCREEIQSSRKGVRDEAVRRLGYLKGCEKQGVHPREWVVGKVPVLPPTFRPVSQMQGGQQLISDANYLYKEVFDANRNLKDLDGKTDDVSEERETLYKTFKAVTGLGDPVQPKNQERRVKGMLAQVFGDSPKRGVVQQKLLGTSVDLVGRAVVTPNPDLSMDEVGLPENRAWEVYAPMLVRRLVRGGMSRVLALQSVKDRTANARKALLSELDERPVLVNRAPVLHRYGLMAFYPRLTKGDVLQVSPLVVGGFGMDFDGDQQIGVVYAAIDRDKRVNIEWTMTSHSNLEAHIMPFDGSLDVPALDAGDDLYVFNLEDFPHGERVRESRGQYGLIDWYRVPAGVKVLAHRPDGSLGWSAVSLWSKHHGCPVEVVTLRSGRQLLTDDDPRAVYGVPAGSLTPGRFRPSEAVAVRVLVPRVVSLPVPAASSPATLDASPYGGQYGGPAARFSLRSELALDEDLGYLIGCAAGDGWSSADKDFCLAGVTDAVVEKLDRVIAALYQGQGPTRCTTTSGDSYGESRKHTWSSRSLARLVLDLVGHRAERKHLPVWFLRAPVDFRYGLFAGVMDTDGSVSVSFAKKKSQLMGNASSTSIRLLQEVSLLALSLGIKGRITASKTPAGRPFWVWSPSNYDLGVWGGRAMVHPAKLAAFAYRPVTKANTLVRHDLVPVSFSLAAAVCRGVPMPVDRSLWLPGQSSVYSAFHTAKTSGYTSRDAAERVTGYLRGGELEHPDWAAWRALVADAGVTWDPVESYEATGVVEDGFDLTVPGAETFTAVDGVILSNTSNYQVVADDDAAREALQKMLPSRNLIGVQDLKKPVYVPRQEYVGGLWASTSGVNHHRRPRVFATTRDALQAYERGEMDPGDPVEIAEEK